RIIVGLNKFQVASDGDPVIFPVDPELERGQKAALAEFKAARDSALVEARLADITAAARGTQNLLYPMKEALRASATLGEVSDALRAVFGVYRAGS
ncbi:MAG TPA: methylmalonyl-CoA mutase family protein, partial [Ilumatobacteraceae bacterium]|nr:methylmalonyl-CoA mutase family protein [Ilumatobacteraceae bacterium]